MLWKTWIRVKIEHMNLSITKSQVGYMAEADKHLLQEEKRQVEQWKQMPYLHERFHQDHLQYLFHYWKWPRWISCDFCSASSWSSGVRSNLKTWTKTYQLEYHLLQEGFKAPLSLEFNKYTCFPPTKISHRAQRVRFWEGGSFILKILLFHTDHWEKT